MERKKMAGMRRGWEMFSLVITGGKNRKWITLSMLIGLLIPGMIMLGGCSMGGEREREGQETPTIEKGVLVLEEDVVEEYPEIAEAPSITGDAADNPAGLLQEVCGCTMVKLKAGKLNGSGVILASDRRYLWIVTAGHVLDDFDPESGEASILVTFADGFQTQVSKAERKEELDLAILRLNRASLVERVGESETDHGLEYRRAILAQEAFDQLKPGDLALAMGSRSGVGEDAYAGVITQDYAYLEDFGTHMIVAEVPVSPGMSGGGLFDSEGRLLGILCGVSEDGEVAVCPVINLLALELY